MTRSASTEGGGARPRRPGRVILLGLGLLLAAPLGAQEQPSAEGPAAENVQNTLEEAEGAGGTPAPLLPSALAQFTTAVEDREPIDQVTFVPNEVRQIVFFSDLRQLEGRTITHRWIYKGETMAEVPFEVRGPRWRVWSSKDLLEDWIGDWTVEIVTDDGEVIAAETFTYSAPGA